jgi:cardiolipin synthase
LRWLPHFLTALRLLASPLLVWLLLESRFEAALVVVGIAGATDWFDGYAARRLGVTGQLGVVFDPLADKVLLVTLFLALGAIHLVPLWLLLMVLGRDAVIVVGALLLRLFRNARQFIPTFLGKVSTFFQITLVLLVLIEASFPNEWFLLLENSAVVLCVIFTVLSWLEYLGLGIRMTKATAPQGPSAK